jgi:hypothetical protein
VRSSRSRYGFRAGIALGLGALVVGFGSVSPTVAGDARASEDPAAPALTTTPTPESPAPTEIRPEAEQGGPSAAEADATSGPYGAGYPITIEPTFSRPNGGYMKGKDFSLLNDLERVIRGSYKDPRTGKLRPESERTGNIVRISISRMENSHRVGRELIAAAKNGVHVSVIHGKASQSKESRALQSKLGSVTYKGKHTAAFHICSKGKSLACLSPLGGAIMHAKILLVQSTFTKDNKPAIGAVWSGSANLGGPSGEYTFNNGWTLYNDRKIYNEIVRTWADMWAERDVGTHYPGYIAAHASLYGYDGATSDGYVGNYATRGMFYSNLSNTTYYFTPIRATPSNQRDPVINLLDRIVPDSSCRIRVQHNRFKYRRIGVAQRLVKLAAGGCSVELVSFRDELAVNRSAHCQQWIRICKPILDVLRTSVTKMPAAYAKPHDKTMLVEAKLRANPWNSDERLPNGQTFSSQPGGIAFVRVVQAGSAALTGSNLVVSDEVTTESTDPAVYREYLEHWDAIGRSSVYRAWKY